MKMTGQILRENREKRKITLAEVALATKINVKILSAMESGDLPLLPTKTVLRGFVRSYARYLTLDESIILSSFQEEMGTTKPLMNGAVVPIEAANVEYGHTPQASSTDAGNPLPSPSSAHNIGERLKAPGARMKIEGVGQTTTIAMLASVVILVALIFIFKDKMRSYEENSHEANQGLSAEATNPSGSKENMTKTVDASSATVAAATGSSVSSAPPSAASSASAAVPAVASAKVTVSAPPAAPAPSASTPPPAASAPAVSSLTETAEDFDADTPPSPAAAKSTSAAPTAGATPAPAPAHAPTPAATVVATTAVTAATTAAPRAPQRVREIMIEALNTVEFDVQEEGGKVEHIKLEADAQKVFKVKKKIILNLKDGGAVNLGVDGHDRGVPGDLGKPMRLELP